jgi:hypothetical protein
MKRREFFERTLKRGAAVVSCNRRTAVLLTIESTRPYPLNH